MVKVSVGVLDCRKVLEMTHISPCPNCKAEIVYRSELTEDEKKRNCVLYPELQMHNYCPKCNLYLFSYPITLDMRYHSQLEGTKSV